MSTKILDTVVHALNLFDESKKEEAIKLLNAFLETVQKDPDNQEEYDLAMEAYIFLTDGDLREEGRDFGFSNTEDIRKKIENIKLKIK